MLGQRAVTDGVCCRAQHLSRPPTQPSVTRPKKQYAVRHIHETESSMPNPGFYAQSCLMIFLETGQRRAHARYIHAPTVHGRARGCVSWLFAWPECLQCTGHWQSSRLPGEHYPSQHGRRCPGWWHEHAVGRRGATRRRDWGPCSQSPFASRSMRRTLLMTQVIPVTLSLR